MKNLSIALIVVYLLLYIFPLGVRPIMAPDESRYAEIPREMIASGDWIVPHLNGFRYFEKPVMGYWLNALSILLFGENAFSIRFPSAISAGMSALMIFILVRRFAGGYSAGILSAAIFLTCFEVYAIGTFSVLDSMLSMCLTGAMISFYYGYFRENSEFRIQNLEFRILFGVCCGLAFLIKGFLAFVVPILSILPFMIWERRWKELLKTSWIPILSAILISLPWCIMVHLRESDFWHYFFWVEHIKRFSANDAQHASPMWFFIPVILGGALPWTALFPAAFSGIKQKYFKESFNRFIICWFLFPFLFFSVSRGKLVTYILPCFPPLAIFITKGLLNYFETGKQQAFKIGALCVASLCAVITGALAINQITGFPGITAYSQTENWKWILGAIGLITWTSLSLIAVKEIDVKRKLVLYFLSPVAFMFISHFIMPDMVIKRKSPGQFFLSHSHRIKPDSIIVSHEDPVREVCWFYKRNDVYLIDLAGELDYGVGFDDSKHRKLYTNEFSDFIRKHSGKKDVFFITRTKDYDQSRDKLPKPIFEDSNGEFVFVQY